MWINNRNKIKQRKNERLQKQVDTLRVENEQLKADIDRQHELIKELEELHTAWEINLDGAKKARKEYEDLIAQLKFLRKKMR